MEALYNPVGFAADVLAICNAFGIRTPAQKQEWDDLMERIDEINSNINQLSENITESEKNIQNTIRDCSIDIIRLSLPKNLQIPSESCDLTLKLFSIIKGVKKRIVFAIVIRSPFRNNVKTIGMAGASTDRIDDLLLALNRLYVSVTSSTHSKTTFISARCRGKTDIDLENKVAAALSCIVMEVLGLPPVGDLTDMLRSDLGPCGKKTIGLLRAKTPKVELLDWDELCRIFIIGDTRTGKSTIGNAMTQNTTFTVSKGTTGTLNVCCEKIVKNIDGTRWLTEIYDTPGLNDKDHLDPYYIASIEDTIVAVNEVSALVLTISVGEGIKGSILDCIETYKKLFGTRMTSLLFIVLTTNDEADEEDCEEWIDLNYDTIVGYIPGLNKKNVLCVSLPDLRNGTDTYSHMVVSRLMQKCRSMRLTIVESLMEELADLEINLREKRVATQAQVQKCVNDGWLKYERLMKEYESASYSKVCSDHLGFVNGFVYKHCNPKTRVLTAASAFLYHPTPKNAVHISYSHSEFWDKFVQSEKQNSDDSGAMRRFGDTIEREGLAVLVEEMASTFVGTRKVRRHVIRLWSPHVRAVKPLKEFIRAKMTKSPELQQYIIERVQNQNLATLFVQGFEKKGFEKQAGAGSSFE